MEVKYRKVEDLPDIGSLDAGDALQKLTHTDVAKSDDEVKELVLAKILASTATRGTKASDITNFSDFKNELKEATIGDENEVKFSTIKKKIEDILKDGNQAVKDAQKAESDALKKLKETEKALKNDVDAYRSIIQQKVQSRGKMDKLNDKENSAIGPIKAASFMVTIITTMASAIVDIIKFRNSQARKIYARAVSYKESYDYDYELAFTEADSLV